MAKSRKFNVLKTVKTTSKRVLPSIDKGLKTVGTTAKNVAESSIPVLEKGVSAVYGTMATGFDLGVKGARTVAKGARSVAKGSKRHHKGGKSRKGRTRRHRRRH